MANKNDQLIIAYYQNIPTATGAAQEMMDWDEADDDIKLGAVAIIGYDPRIEELVVNEIGARNTRKGALWGTAVGATLGILTLGVALIPGLIIGAGTGAAIGAVDRQDVVLTEADTAELMERLRYGAGAVAVMADDFEVEQVKLFLARLGGDVNDFRLPEETAVAVTAAAAAQTAAGEAVDEAIAAMGEVQGLAAVGSLSDEDVAKLHEEGIDKPSKLLAQGATPAGRAELAEVTGLPEDVILLAVQEMDLMRVNGVGPKYAALLLTAGVDSVPDLALRNGSNLLMKLADVNEQEHVVEVLPSEEEVIDWVVQANEMPRIVTF